MQADRAPCIIGVRWTTGSLQGANYSSAGDYRPELQCLMFDRSEAFCDVCAEAVGDIINLYSRTP